MTSTYNVPRGKRGIHPAAIAIIIGAALLIVVGIVYLWMTMEARAGHAIWIQNVEFKESSTLIYVQNVGEGTVTVVLVHIDAEKFNIYPSNCTIASEETTTIMEGQTAEITVNHAYREKVHIKVICTDGTSHEGYWKP